MSNAYKLDIDRKQQKKHRRSVKNEIIQIDDIDEGPGINFYNWIRITKLKLAERESKLMSIRANILQGTINKQIEEFKSKNARMKIYIHTNLYENIVNKQLIKNCLDKLNQQLIKPWKGIVLKHSKNSYGSYRKYFSTSRSWFDQRKRAILAQYFWIPIFDTIKTFAKISASQYFNERLFELQSKYVESLTLQIVTSIFKQKLKLPMTRPHSLISCSILKESHVFQAYLQTNIHKKILVGCLLQDNPDMMAVTLMGLIINQLQTLSMQSNLSFQKDTYQLYDEFNFKPVYIEPLTDYSQNITNFNRNKYKNTNNHRYINDSYDQKQCYDYKPYHSQSNSVANKRFSPLW